MGGWEGGLIKILAALFLSIFMVAASSSHVLPKVKTVPVSHLSSEGLAALWNFSSFGCLAISAL